MSQNKLTILMEPINEIDEFSKLCVKLLADADGDITIEFANNVRTISSTYIGALFNIHIMADQIGRKLTIVCHSSLSRWINMVSGNKILNIQTYDS